MNRVSLFASGGSVLEISLTQWEFIKRSCVISTNYPISLVNKDVFSAFLFISDNDTLSNLTTHEYKLLVLTKQLIENNKINHIAHLTIDRFEYTPYNDTTFLVALQFIRQLTYAPIDIYGLDFTLGKNCIKWYDEFENSGRRAKFTKENYDHRMTKRTMSSGQKSFKDLFDEYYYKYNKLLQPISFYGKYRP